MATDLAAELEKSFASSDTEFANQQAAYQKEVTDYQDKYNRGLITRSEARTLNSSYIPNSRTAHASTDSQR